MPARNNTHSPGGERIFYRVLLVRSNQVTKLALQIDARMVEQTAGGKFSTGAPIYSTAETLSAIFSDQRRILSQSRKSPSKPLGQVSPS